MACLSANPGAGLALRGQARAPACGMSSPHVALRSALRASSLRRQARAVAGRRVGPAQHMRVAATAAPAATAQADFDSQVTVVLGMQWGDEGKGKLVDIFAQNSDVVARAQARAGGCGWG